MSEATNALKLGVRCSRRDVFLGLGATLWSPTARGQGATFVPNTRYPDPAVQILDPAFASYRVFNSSVEQLATGFRWAEGPVWFGDGRYLLFSDIPNDRILRWDETSGHLSVFRQPSNFSNGLARDRQGRLLTCEHATRRVTRTEYDGRVTVLADRFNGKPLNSPNDIVCQADGTIWFTDPPFGISSDYEGSRANPELPTSVYRLDAKSGQLNVVLTDLAAPNGLCFSPDEKRLYVVEARAQPHRLVWSFDVGAGGQLSNKRVLIDAGSGTPDGLRCDREGNLWCGWGSNGSSNAPGHTPADLDGVMVFNPQGKPVLHIRLPERCANLCFGGPKRNRLFMASSHSLYSVHVNTVGAL
jgi:gluconolactonase